MDCSIIQVLINHFLRFLGTIWTTSLHMKSSRKTKMVHLQLEFTLKRAMFTEAFRQVLDVSVKSVPDFLAAYPSNPFSVSRMALGPGYPDCD